MEARRSWAFTVRNYLAGLSLAAYAGASAAVLWQIRR